MKTKITIKPYDTLQISFQNKDGTMSPWSAYGTIRVHDIDAAKNNVKRGLHVINIDGVKAKFRIVRDSNVVMA